MRRDQRPQTPAEALTELQAGNERFARGESIYPRLDHERIRHVASHGQQPHTTVLACSDSRCPVELLFDQGVGDIFVVRVAGNLCSRGTLASIEFGVAYLGTPLCVVLGHTKCGAIEAVASSRDYEGSIERFLEPLSWPVERARNELYGRSDEEQLLRATELNVQQVIRDLYSGSELLSQAVAEGRAQIAGAVYDIASGHVNWLPEQSADAHGAGLPHLGN